MTAYLGNTSTASMVVASRVNSLVEIGGVPIAGANQFRSAAVALWFNAAVRIHGVPLSGNAWRVLLGDPQPEAAVQLHKMRGQAADDLTLDTWVVSGEPDFEAAQYTGPLTTPLRDVVLLDSWTND